MKPFTIENLKQDRACAEGMQFVIPIIERGECVPTALVAAGHYDWLSWAIEKGYDCEVVRSKWLTWDEQGRIHATAGYKGTATAGAWDTATAGAGGTATAGAGGTATVGEGGIIQIKHWDGSRYRLVTGYIGENGLKPNTPYKLDANGEFVEVEE